MLMQQMRYLVARAKCSSFASGRALRQLEDELGVAIVERGNRFRGFTDEGAVVLRWARRILDDERALMNELGSLHGAPRGTLRLGVIPSANAIVPPLTTSFARAFPHVTIDETETTSNEIVRKLAAFELDAGITYVDNEPIEHVRILPIAQERYVIVLPADGPLASLEAVSWTQAATLPLCLLQPGMQNRRIVDATFAALGVVPRVHFEADSMMAKLSYLASGTVASIMPNSLEPWLRHIDGMRVLPLVEPEVAHMVGLVIVERDPVPSLIDAFWSHVAALAAPASTTQPAR